MFENKSLWLLLLFLVIPMVLRIKRDMGFQKVSSHRIKIRMVGLGLLSFLVSALLLGRIGYRIYQGSNAGGWESMMSDQNLAGELGVSGLGRSPISLMILLLLLSYYSAYYLLVTRRAAGLIKTMPIVTD